MTDSPSWPSDTAGPREIFRGRVFLAPLTMGGNLPYRRLCKQWGAGASVGEMALALKVAKGSRRELALMRTHADDHPFGVQLADNQPDRLAEAACVAAEKGADFIDINAGCPIDLITRRGLGARLLQRPRRLVTLIEAVVRAVALPVSVKIRSGWNASRINALEVGRAVEQAGARAVILHARSREQRYRQAADWDLIGELTQALSIPVVGNGDLLCPWEAHERWTASGCASVMVGRGALIKPWIFHEIRTGEVLSLSPAERLNMVLDYVAMALEHFGDDERGRRQVMRFTTWHLGFWSRWRHLPEVPYRELAAGHPLLQTRLPPPSSASSGEPAEPLERLMHTAEVAWHEKLAATLTRTMPDRDEAHTTARRLACDVPPATCASTPNDRMDEHEG